MSQNWLQHTLQRRNWQPQNQAVALATIGIIIGLILGALYLTQVVSFATTNRQIEELLAERDALELANEQLRAEIAALKTVPRLLARAQALGFRPAQSSDIEYLVVAGYNPSPPDTVVPESPDDEVALPVYDETFGGWLQQQWDLLTGQFNRFGASSASDE